MKEHRPELVTAAQTAHNAAQALWGITEPTLYESGARHVSEARKAVWAHLRIVAGASYPELGRLYYRDHTTVLAGVQTVNEHTLELLNTHVAEGMDGNTPHDHYLRGWFDGYAYAQDGNR